MDIHDVLAEGRAAALGIMTDTVVVSRRSSTPVTDPETHQVTYPTEIIYEGRGRVQSRDIEGQDYTDAGVPVMVMAFQSQLPVTVPLQKDDLIEVVARSEERRVGEVSRG